MSYQVIMRPVFNREEMFYLSLEYEIKARESYKFSHDLHTVFVVEHGATDNIIKMIDKYPFSSSKIIRKQRLGLTVNILEAMKTSFQFAEDFLIVIEDDVLLHNTYFKYMDSVLNLNEKFSVISAYNPKQGNDVNKIHKGHHYASLAQLINKRFYNDYISVCSTTGYYNDPVGFCLKLNSRYQHFTEYKYKDATHHQQAGMINRLVDIALIEDAQPVLIPDVDRMQHIGYGFSPNRPGGTLPGNSFEERLDNLREIIKDPKKMFDSSAMKCYNDYRVFNGDLDTWDGKLIL